MQTANGYKEYNLNIGDAHITFFSDKGTLSNKQSYVIRTHSHEFCELFYVLEGTVKIYTNNAEYSVQAGDCAVIPMGLFHRSEICENSKRIVISFVINKKTSVSAAPYYEQLKKVVSGGILVLKNFVGANAFLRYSQYHFENYAENDELLTACFQEIIALIKHSLSSVKGTAGEDFKNNHYREYVIDNYFSENFKDASLQKLSSLIFLSQQQTQRVIKKMYSQTFSERVVYLKMKYAAELLIKTDLSLNKIANEVGYESLNGFLKAFTKHYGISPVKYRRKNS